jgi:hypothetical protein
MLGAIARDIFGSIYEAAPIKTKRFQLFGPGITFTDVTCAPSPLPRARLRRHVRALGAPAGHARVRQLGQQRRDAGERHRASRGAGRGPRDGSRSAELSHGLPMPSPALRRRFSPHVRTRRRRAGSDPRRDRGPLRLRSRSVGRADPRLVCVRHLVQGPCGRPSSAPWRPTATRTRSAMRSRRRFRHARLRHRRHRRGASWSPAEVAEQAKGYLDPDLLRAVERFYGTIGQMA